MKYRLYANSHKAWDGMIKAIAKAETSVYLEMFILLGDTNKTHNFFQLLKDKALSGVEVIIIADSIGSSALKSEIVKELRAAGIEFRFFSHWLRWTHRKILIVDRRVAFLGGVNIKEEIRNWRDMQIRLEGGVVKLVLKSFAKSYSRCGGRNASVLNLAKTSLPRKIKYWVLDNWADTAQPYYLNNYYRHKIAEAKSSIQIVTPYLLPPRWLLIALDNACRRGVKVELIIPEDTDVKALNRINHLNSCRLAAVGVKIYFIEQMNHAKVMLIDDEEVVIGSQNMDILSLGPGFDFMRLGYEVGVFSRQHNLVADIKKVIDGWREEAKLFDFKLKKLGILDQFMMFLLRFLYPIF